MVKSVALNKVAFVINQPESKLSSSTSSGTDTILDGIPMDEWDDTDLIGACLAGDEYAWKALIERYSRLIYTIPFRFGFSKIIADEIFQETCLILLEKLDTLRDRERLSSWLVTVTRRACIKRWRQKDIQQTVDLVEADQPAEGTLEDELSRLEAQYLVRRAIERLGPRCRRLLVALFLEALPRSYQTIADELDMPVGSIGPTRARCLEKLRREIAKLERQGTADRQNPSSQLQELDGD